MALRGIDVSGANGTIDWDRVKEQIDFAIIRIGWGDDIESQDDNQAIRNMDECDRLGIPYGVYLYSYAISESECDSEINHALRMVENYNPTLGIWYDMEDADGYKERHDYSPYEHCAELTSFCRKFVDVMEERGYKSGVYANWDYFKNVVDRDMFSASERWLAIWGVDEAPMDCYMWQYTSDGDIDGNGSSRMDMNYLYDDVPDVKPIIDDGGYSPTPREVDVVYQVMVDGEWLPEVTNDEDYAGIVGKSIEGVAIKVSDGYCTYRVHDCNGWHADIYSRNTDIDDYVNGYAGDNQPIDAITIYYYTPEGQPYKKAKYRVSTLNANYYSYQYDDETSNGQDGYAGCLGAYIDRLQIVIE